MGKPVRDNSYVVNNNLAEKKRTRNTPTLLIDSRKYADCATHEGKPTEEEKRETDETIENGDRERRKKAGGKQKQLEYATGRNPNQHGKWTTHHKYRHPESRLDGRREDAAMRNKKHYKNQDTYSRHPGNKRNA